MKVYNRYALSLHELALEQNSVDLINTELKNVSKIFKDNTEFFDILTSPNISNSDKITMIDNVFLNNAHDLTLNFIKILCTNNRLVLFFDMIKEFQKITHENNNELKVTFTTAVDLDTDTQKKLIDKAGIKTSKTILPLFIVDSKILGGVIMSYDNTLIDGSVKTKLLNLNKYIRK